MFLTIAVSEKDHEKGIEGNTFDLSSFRKGL